MTDDEWIDAWRLGLGTGIAAIETVRCQVASLPVEWIARDVVEQIMAEMASGLRIASAGA